MRDSRENGISFERIRRKFTREWKFLTVLIDGSYIFSPFFLLSYRHITFGLIYALLISLRFLVDVRNDYHSREINPLAANFFVSFLIEISSSALFYRLIKIDSLVENLSEGFIHPDNHLSASVVCKFLSSCKNVPPGGKA